MFFLYYHWKKLTLMIHEILDFKLDKIQLSKLLYFDEFIYIK